MHGYMQTFPQEKQKKKRAKNPVDNSEFSTISTGFSTGGATFDDIALFAAHVEKHVKIKAAGGISSLEDAEKFLALGASRLGTSRIVKIVKKMPTESVGY